jgi:hypothetical protein
VALNDLAQAFPRDHSVHLVEKLRTSRRLGIAFKTGGCKRDLLVRHKQIISENSRRINQSILSAVYGGISVTEKSAVAAL